MWASQSYDDEGGFNTTMTQSPAAGAGKNLKQNTVIPVAIRELLVDEEENKNTHVVVVGIITQVKTLYIYINNCTINAFYMKYFTNI